MSLRLPDSGAGTTADGRRHAPSSARNAEPILSVLKRIARPGGKALEIAAGSGQHAAAFAPALSMDWQPTDVEPGNFASIRAWSAGTGIRPPVVLDATLPGWGAQWHGQDLVLVVNLLHLIPAGAADTLIAEAARALSPGGRLAIYGPFLRDGRTTSPGDAAFDASLRAQDPRLGYKDLGHVLQRLGAAGLGTEVVPMPANNLMLAAFRICPRPGPAPAAAI